MTTNNSITRLSTMLCVLAAGLIGLSTAVVAHADQTGVKLFTGPPPAASELADLLFPRQTPALRTRSLVFTNTQPAQRAPTQRPEGFGFLINFDFNSAKIQSESKPYLDQVGEMLNLEHVRDEKIIIEGHTDASGSADYNQRLSQQRAEAVKAYLVAAYKIEPQRLITAGKGEAELLAGKRPLDAENRRVQFHRAHP